MDGTGDLALPAARTRQLRIAVVTETYPPEVNGVAMTLGHIVRGLTSRGHTVELVRPRQRDAEVPAQRPRLEEVLVRGMAIPRYDALKLGLPARTLLLRQWTSRRPDVVHLVTEGPLGWSGLSAAKALGLPIASDFHTNFHSYTAHYGVGWLRRPVTAYLRRLHNKCRCTIVPTIDLRDDLAGLGFQNLLIVARGVDTETFNPGRRDPILRQTWRASASDPVALFVSRIAPEKNMHLVLETYEAMRHANPRVKLVVVGDGPERLRLQQRYPDAIFAGTRHGTDLAAHYASADLFLFPSLTETYGNVIVEALASGLAVLAFDYAAARQHIRQNVNGVTVSFGDREGFIRAAIELGSDSDRRARLGDAARASMVRVDWNRIVGEFEGTLADVVAEHERANRAHPCA
jgi:glycosyltransferase involved in cell wall biosynthesis